jgi:hypothetical protein
MAHLIDAAVAENNPPDLNLDFEDESDAQFASISHSRALVSPNEHEFDLVTRKVNVLMAEGRGECIFEVGLGTDPPSNDEPNGDCEDAEAASGLNKADYDASVATLSSIAGTLDADCVLLRERVLSGGGPAGAAGDAIPAEARRTGQYLLRQRADTQVCQAFFIFLPAYGR